jgi:hypothetical protein
MNHPDEEACDFLTYLAWRLGTERDNTAEMLGEWLANYSKERRAEKAYCSVNMSAALREG